ncbi:hypothetical protein M2454_003093 [Aequitasia blattaphilus]|uniref:Uncharacterized protein n=1 Tax=Aequitasia blattaphilus TaxID=2949332 RepID=A0ABT1EFR6_9FIRM|nr:hypothetical protein [Aequitasia blattaphilus]MCP1103757.1 hypothetical protein [Aequitasia blattaphilus]MCR8616397.1 hypothetical protein [Aequitasia blattaphilus]
MKKIIPIVLLWFLYAFQSEATNDGVYMEKVQECEEFQNILDLEEEAIEMIQEGYPMTYHEEISENDIEIDYSRMYKVYVDTGIENAKTNNAETIKEYLEKSDYFWRLPVDVNGKKVEVAYGKHRYPLTDTSKAVMTEEQIARYESTMGMWVCQGVSLGVEQYLSEALEEASRQVECEEAVVVKSIPGFDYGVGITFHDQKAQNLLGLNQPYPLIEEENIEKIKKSRKFSEKNNLEKEVFEFEQAMELSNAFKPTAGLGGTSGTLDLTADGFNKNRILLMVGIVILVGGGVLFYKKTTKR